ncbi:MAG: hypothetical protein ACJAY7_000723 [Pseudohongiellaceae bacterium]|jgi:hypothetical protein
MIACGVKALSIFLSTVLASHPQLPTSNFQLPTSNFQLPTSNFQLPTSNFPISLWQAGLPIRFHCSAITDPDQYSLIFGNYHG